MWDRMRGGCCAVPAGAKLTLMRDEEQPHTEPTERIFSLHCSGLLWEGKTAAGPTSLRSILQPGALCPHPPPLTPSQPEGPRQKGTARL